MIDVGITLVLLVAAVVISEVALGERKLQTGLASVLRAWVVTGAMLLAHLALARGSGVLVAGVFWAGAFLSWFGMRSHVESSILLRMLYLLRGRTMTGDELVAAYERQYGPEQRVEELVRSGLAEKGPDGTRITAKGKSILAATDWLR